MTRGFSLYLDALRFGAALVVVLSHLGYERFTGGHLGWIRDLNLGSDAVVVFFVLSGLVIAFSAERKDPTLGRFAFNRLTRVMSVALPTLLVGFVLDLAGAALAPGFYYAPFYAPLPLPELLLRGLTFSNEWAGLDRRLGTNGPYWSLSYEVAYYALFAVGFYLRGTRRAVLLAAGALLAGVNILLLMPSWLLGVWVWRRLSDGRLPSRSVALGLAVAAPLAYAAALWFGVPGLLRELTETILSVPPGRVLRFSDEFLWNGLIGIAFALHLLGMARLLRPTERDGKAIRWLAGGSFSLYLLHYPLLQFFGGTLPKTGAFPVDAAALLCATLAGCYAFAQVFERTLPAQRRMIARLRMDGGAEQAQPRRA